MHRLRDIRSKRWLWTLVILISLGSVPWWRLNAQPATSADETSAPKAQPAPKEVPGEYVPTGPKYKYKVYREVRVPMQDGVELAAVIVRPDVEGHFPAIMTYSPYRALKGVKEKYGDPAHYSNYSDGPSYFAEHGYAVVTYDVRGTGDSGGVSTDMYGEQEQRDGYAMVEWIASQPWSSGKVGMWGFSYNGVDQWQVGVQQPPHLTTMIVGSANTNVYLDWNYPGGCLRPFMFTSYSPGRTGTGFAPPNIDLTGDQWADIWKQHLDGNLPWGVGYISNQLDGPYWQKKSLSPRYDRINVPVLIWSGWADWYPTPSLDAFAHVHVPKKIYVGPWGHYWPDMALPGPRIDFPNIMMRWFDYWLKGEKNGAMDGPPVTMWVRKYKAPSERYYDEDAGFWRYENEWPLARTQDTPLYLRAGGSLSSAAASAGEAPHDQYRYRANVGITAGVHSGGGVAPWGYQLDQRPDEVYSLTYTTPPLEKDTEVAGNPQAILYVASTARTAYFNVTLTDVAPDGTSKWTTHGALLASHRNSHEHAEPLVPGQVYELKIPLRSIAYIFEAGHRIRVDVASANFQNAWPTADPAVDTIYHSAQYPSHVVLPMAPPQSPRLPAPILPPSHYVLKTETEMLAAAPERLITTDLVNETTTLTESTGSDAWHKNGDDGTESRARHTAVYTVSDKDPAKTTIRTVAVSAFRLPGGMEVEVQTNEVVTSNKDSFIYMPHVEVIVNGKTHFSKSWTIQIPRNLN